MDGRRAHRQNEVVIRAAAAAAAVGYVAGGYSTVHDGVLGPWFLADFAAVGPWPCAQASVISKYAP